jgi:hypothetical protein
LEQIDLGGDSSYLSRNRGATGHRLTIFSPQDENSFTEANCQQMLQEHKIHKQYNITQVAFKLLSICQFIITI